METGRQELFDLVTDVGETTNLIEQKPGIAKDLAAELQSWRREVNAQKMRPNPRYVPNPQGDDGIIRLPARTAEVHGVQLRYEPSPHKETLGFWTRAEDRANWEFEVRKPGVFEVEILQGCGKGQGGSVVEFTMAQQTLTVQVEDTGGFQEFKNRSIDKVRLSTAGRYSLVVKPKRKAAAAVMDLRSVTLKPIDSQ
jgi:hypothetical protein